MLQDEPATLSDPLLVRALADLHELKEKVRALEHFVETRVPLALLRAAANLEESEPERKTLMVLEEEFARLKRDYGL